MECVGDLLDRDARGRGEREEHRFWVLHVRRSVGETADGQAVVGGEAGAAGGHHGLGRLGTGERVMRQRVGRDAEQGDRHGAVSCDEPAPVWPVS